MLTFSLSGVIYETGGVTLRFKRIGGRDIAKSLYKHGIDDATEVSRETKGRAMDWHTSFITECLTGIEGLADCVTGQPIVYDDMSLEQRTLFIEYLMDEDDQFMDWVQGYMSGTKKKSIALDEGQP